MASYICYDYTRNAAILPEYFLENRKEKAKPEQNAGIIGINSSKIHLVNYSRYA